MRQTHTAVKRGRTSFQQHREGSRLTERKLHNCVEEKKIMGIQEMDASDSTVSGVEKQSDVGFSFGAST